MLKTRIKGEGFVKSARGTPLAFFKLGWGEA